MERYGLPAAGKPRLVRNVTRKGTRLLLEVSKRQLTLPAALKFPELT
jgi:hypothetical protein